MKTLIVYASKYGTTETCSQMLQEDLPGDVTRINVKKEKLPNVAEFDTILIGGSIYAGRIQKAIRTFCSKEQDVLLQKNIGLFLCCMSKGEKVEEQLRQAFPPQLVEKAFATACFGGEFRFHKMNFLDKWIIKMVSKSEPTYGEINVNQDVFQIDRDSITAFAAGCK